ncbi:MULTISPECIES: Flp family type IVb pilin [Pandoraea]|uniref:Pilus assembly protein n=1 Tax=Pandoraea capi TaxID=2508286 RepID=A0ABY6VT48_9BURK|nr:MULTISPECIES: Flp family type IVb pilin [Pandoraea]MCI3206944.1 Flp family type IVb pilin [Pandoraea sp. LA3]MDN4584972.1 Flp family type IVb pilin [Pandoraea capi]ODP31979.1 pilus assembly protein [Pandoraea sp. ISTKB]VVD85634.1 pilus assembly protein [Pandoraea capi]
MQANRASKTGRQLRLSRQKGVTALEYGILAAIVAVIIGGTVYTNMSSVLSSAFSTVTSAATSASSH